MAQWIAGTGRRRLFFSLEGTDGIRIIIDDGCNSEQREGGSSAWPRLCLGIVRDFRDFKPGNLLRYVERRTFHCVGLAQKRDSKCDGVVEGNLEGT